MDTAGYLKQVLETIDENRLLWKMIHQLRLNESVRAIVEPDFATLLQGVLGDLEVYCREPWLLLAIVDGLASSRLQGVPMPPDEAVIDSVVRCLELINER